MHELSLVQSILEIAQDYARREGAVAIQTVTLRVGALSGVEPEALEFAFETARVGTLAEEARLEVEWVPLAAYCEGCSKKFAVDNPFGIALCPDCGQVSAEICQGEELQVAYLDVI